MKRAIPIRSFGRMFHPFDATGDDDAPFAPIDAGSLYYMRFGGTAPHLTRAGTGHAPVPRDPPAAPASGGADPADAPGQAITFATASTPVSAAAVSAAAVSASKVDSNAVLAMRADIASSTYKLSGAGIRIGILSDSFNLLGGATADTARGDLPSNVTILKEGTAGADEGRAMAELIHRVAPDAQIVFYSGTSSETDFANGILALKAAGCGVIVDDLLWMDEPFWQDGNVVQKAVEQVVASGVDYFTAAGNAGSNFYQAAFRPIRIALPGLFGTYYAAGFGAGNAARATESLSVAAGRTVTIELQWDQPYASIGSGHSSVNSLGMVLYDSKGRIVASAMANDVGRDPSQQLQFTNTTASTGFSLAVFVNGGSTLPGQFKFVAYGSGVTINDTAAGQGSGSSSGHELVGVANTVGAIAASSTPRLGGNDTVESYSGLSSGTLLFDASGNRYAVPPSGGGVDFVAPDATSTSVFAPFNGTSAAAPNAAAVAALMLQANPWLTPAQITTILRLTAAPVKGAALATGAGLVQANAAVALARTTPRVSLPVATSSVAVTTGTAASVVPGSSAGAKVVTAALDSLATDPTVTETFTASFAANADIAPGSTDVSNIAGSFVMTSGSDIPLFVPQETGLGFA